MASSLPISEDRVKLLEARLTGGSNSNEGFPNGIPMFFRVETRMANGGGEEDTKSSTGTEGDASHASPPELPMIEAPHVPSSPIKNEEEETPLIYGDIKEDASESTPRKRKMFTREEDDKILQGVVKYGPQWEEIIRWANLERSAIQLKKRYKRLEKKTPSATASPSASIAATSPGRGLVDHMVTEGEDDVVTCAVVPGTLARPSLITSGLATVTPEKGPPLKPMGKIDSYFVKTDASKAHVNGQKAASVGITGAQTLRKADGLKDLDGSTMTPQKDQAMIQTQRDEISRLEQLLSERDAKMAKLEADLQSALSFKEQVLRYEKELESCRRREDERESQVQAVLQETMKQRVMLERRDARFKLSQDCWRIGRVSMQRIGTVISDVWEDGIAFQELASKLEKLKALKEQIETQKKLLAKKRLPPPSNPNAIGDGPPSEFEGLTADELAEAEEIHKMRLAALKKEEQSVMEEREGLEREKAVHVREIKRQRDEDASRWNNTPLLNCRYLLLNMLGKGGFSQVYLAYDVKELRYVACKIHELNPLWSDEKKHNYIRHATREYNIHKQLVHPRVVRLYDVFEIDLNAFCTVLEHCDGGDLDLHLKTHRLLAEKEARSIIVQIFSGLRYLNMQKNRIIHYDLKPGNILFHRGEVKITDFGLSKVLDDDQSSLDLTSQGAGTYWYLPPECFEMGQGFAPRISSKVDVWSCGVILYQMLYGRKPFGNDQSQEKILTEMTILRATSVQFPPKPAISPEAKDFIRKCLAHRQEERPDVLTVFSDQYLKLSTKKQST